MRPGVIMHAGVIMRPGAIMRRRGMHMRGHSRQGGGTQLQCEGHAVGRHEAGGNVGTKQEQDQHEDAGPGASLPML